jgi:hypothetical protein
MDGEIYIVFLRGAEVSHPFKLFTTRDDARAFANEQVHGDTEIERVEIYKVSGSAGKAAIAALQMGEGVLVETKSRQSPSTETEREWERAQKLGPDAVLKFLGLD